MQRCWADDPNERPAFSGGHTRKGCLFWPAQETVGGTMTPRGALWASGPANLPTLHVCGILC